MFVAKAVTGRDANGTTYGQDYGYPYNSCDKLINTVAQATFGKTWDVFNHNGELVARVHVDGGVDYQVRSAT